MTTATLPPGWTIPDQERFSLAEVAAITGFSRKSIENGCRRDRIPHHHHGRQRFLTRAQLVEFIASTEVKVDTTPRQRASAGTSPTQIARIDEHKTRVAARLGRKRGAA